MNIQNCDDEIYSWSKKRHKIVLFKNDLPYEMYDFTKLNELKIKLWDSIRHNKFKIESNNTIVKQILDISNDIEKMKFDLSEFYIKNDYIVVDPFKHNGFFIARQYNGGYGIGITKYLNEILKLVDKEIEKLVIKKEKLIIDEVDKLLDNF